MNGQQRRAARVLRACEIERERFMRGDRDAYAAYLVLGWIGGSLAQGLAVSYSHARALAARRAALRARDRDPLSDRVA